MPFLGLFDKGVRDVRRKRIQLALEFFYETWQIPLHGDIDCGSNVGLLLEHCQSFRPHLAIVLLQLDADTVHVDKALDHFQPLVVVGQQLIRSGQQYRNFCVSHLLVGHKQLSALTGPILMLGSGLDDLGSRQPSRWIRKVNTGLLQNLGGLDRLGTLTFVRSGEYWCTTH